MPLDAACAGSRVLELLVVADALSGGSLTQRIGLSSLASPPSCLPSVRQEFIKKLKAIDGVSQVETQEITFEAL